MLVFKWDNQTHKALVRPNIGITLRDGNSVKSSHFSVVLQRHLELRVLNLDSTPMTRTDYIAPSEVLLCKVWIILCSSDARLTLKPTQTQKKEETVFFFFLSQIFFMSTIENHPAFFSLFPSHSVFSFWSGYLNQPTLLHPPPHSPNLRISGCLWVKVKNSRCEGLHQTPGKWSNLEWAVNRVDICALRGLERSTEQGGCISDAGDGV